MKTFMAALMILGIIGGIIYGAVRITADISFNVECEGYIKRAADATTAKSAKEQLDKVIDYADDHHLTEGWVSIILHQPENDVTFWYNNLVNARNGLEKAIGTGQLQETNVLMKLKETLLDDTSDGVKVTHPSGIEIYPNNKAMCALAIISAAFILIPAAYFKFEYDY